MTLVPLSLPLLTIQTKQYWEASQALRRRRSTGPVVCRETAQTFLECIYKHGLTPSLRRCAASCLVDSIMTTEKEESKT